MHAKDMLRPHISATYLGDFAVPYVSYVFIEPGGIDVNLCRHCGTMAKIRVRR